MSYINFRLKSARFPPADLSLVENADFVIERLVISHTVSGIPSVSSGRRGQLEEVFSS